MSLPIGIAILTKFVKYGAKTGTRCVNCNDKIGKFHNNNHHSIGSN